MKIITITKGQPIPERVHGGSGTRWLSVFNNMSKGDSVLLSARDGSKFLAAMSTYCTRHKCPLLVTSRREGNTKKRVWRIK